MKFDNMNVGNMRKYVNDLSERFETDLKTYEKFLLKKEELEETVFLEDNKYKYLYPNHLDPRFNLRISNKKEFRDLKYPKEKRTVHRAGNEICNAEFELSPHQVFVRNFLSSHTPYNTLLLYHGLGTGKTCSAISVCEEYRDYMNQTGNQKRILIVASPNVQENFKLQLFDHRRLKQINGKWNIQSCTGNKFMKEINPMNMEGLTKEAITKQIKSIIRQHYLFMGYDKFANYINRTMNKYTVSEDTKENETRKKREALHREFSNRLIVIDEVHNINAVTEDKKKVSNSVMNMVTSSENVKLLLLSATPMFNSYREIIWLVNLMNANDKRPLVKERDIFDKRGNFKIVNSREYGKEMFIRKIRGYISFVRGENPYTFPYRIYPKDFDAKHSLLSEDFTYPERQINNVPILQGIEYTDLYVSSIGKYQKYGYSMIVRKLNEKFPNPDEIESGGMGWIQTEPALQSLNIIYPHDEIDTYVKMLKDNDRNMKEYLEGVDVRQYIGEKGLKHCMKYANKSNFEYRKNTLEKYGEIFSPDNIGKYSGKIKRIMDKIRTSRGIVLIYSQYIDGGCVPLALALEQMGVTRYENKNLFKKKPANDVDAITMSGEDVKHKAHYIMITGDPLLSPDNNRELKAVTSDENKDGNKVKVVIVSKAGSEGIDFRNIRQVHILDPWYNLSREEQVIGRAVRYCSHKDLPFRERNVEVYLHSTKGIQEREAVDMYIYRIAERKALQIGMISRIMKENAVDCILNTNTNQLTTGKIDETVELHLSSGKVISFKVGDKPRTHICDYMDNCEYKCSPRDLTLDIDTVDMNTYNNDFLKVNTDKIIFKIKQLYRERFVYKKDELVNTLTSTRNYPLIQIDSALERLISDPYEYMTDVFGRTGTLVNVDDYYMFQPAELSNTGISLYERSVPVEYKRDALQVSLPDEIREHIVEPEPKKKKIILNILKKKEDIDDIGKYEALKIIQHMKEQLTIVRETREIDRGDSDWFKHTAIAIQEIISRHHLEDMDENRLMDYVIHHMVDTLLFKEKKYLIEYVLNHANLEPLEKKIKKYIQRELRVKDGSLRAYLMYDNKSIKLWKESKQGNKIILKETKPTEQLSLLKVLKQNKKYEPTDYAPFVGFMEYISGVIVFKVKDMKRKRHKGARCDQAGKERNISLLNNILSLDERIKETYTKANTSAVRVPTLCSIQELVLRHYHDTNHIESIWFLTNEGALLNEIQSINI